MRAAGSPRSRDDAALARRRAVTRHGLLGRRGRGTAELAALERAAARLAALDLYPEPVDTRRVRILHVPWLFRLPWFRRFRGYNMAHLILLKRPLAEVSDDLITHELCHVWQGQDHWLRLWSSYFIHGYANNPHEREARHAAAVRPAPPAPAAPR
jgi:hypothetical protein